MTAIFRDNRFNFGNNRDKRWTYRNLFLPPLPIPPSPFINMFIYLFLSPFLSHLSHKVKQSDRKKKKGRPLNGRRNNQPVVIHKTESIEVFESISTL